ncbi:hypothetical protein ACWX0P_27270 [Vibrio mediterranei]
MLTNHRFLSVHSQTQIERELEMAQTLIEKDGTAFPDDTFEEGYIATLNFVLNRQGSNVREEFEAVMSESHREGVL